MSDEDFFNFTGNIPPTLEETIRNAGIKTALWFNILANSSFRDAVKQVSTKTDFSASNWKNVGIGIVQDKEGIIKITFIFTE